ncbi:MAG: glutathione peroxidase [Saprospiraceae bacterium]|nr:glutathione peroxidase [Saprospiraceae bacterium]
MQAFYQYTAVPLGGGDPVRMETFRGKYVLIVNTASQCGFTGQYAGLEALYQTRAENLVVLGFPCNQFGGQEPGEADEIAQFCEINYGVTFPMFEKIEVNGSGAHPMFRYLKKALPGLLGGAIKWNFTKFLISPEGEPLKRFAPTDTPEKIGAYLAEILDRSGAEV